MICAASRSSTKALLLKLKELTIFAMLGTIMIVSQIAMQIVPNVHLLGLFVASLTLNIMTTY